jgi:hypothetical protein
MGRNRKPKAIAERDGSFEKHPERRANYENEPKPTGPLGAAPKEFDPDGFTGSRLLAIWNEIIAAAPPGVLTSADRLHVEMTCRIIYRIRHQTPKSGDFNSLREFLSKMAMNPADRPKIQIGVTSSPSQGPDAPEKTNAFAELAEEGRNQDSGLGRPN